LKLLVIRISNNYIVVYSEYFSLEIRQKKKSRSSKKSKKKSKINKKSCRNRSQIRANKKTFTNRSFFNYYFEQEQNNFRLNY